MPFPTDALAAAGLALAAFVSTNFDNLILLVGFLADPSRRPGSVFAGYLAALAAILAGALLVELGADFAPARLMGWLGLLPIGIGLSELIRGWRAPGSETDPVRPRVPAGGAATVAGVMLANGGDSLAVLAALFAETADRHVPLMVGATAAAGAGWCGAARWVASHERAGAALRRLAPRVLPYLMIGIGIYILSDTATDGI